MNNMASTNHKERWILKNPMQDYRKYIHVKAYTPDGFYAIETDGHKVKKSLLKKYYRMYAITFSNPFSVVNFD